MPPAKPDLLAQILCKVPRRYRLSGLPSHGSPCAEFSPATMLAIAIEEVRQSLVQGAVPGIALKEHFVHALADLIREALRAEYGDPMFAAMVLRRQSPAVNEYASLTQHVKNDRRSVRRIVNSFSHPAKLRLMPPGALRERLAQLYAEAAAEDWSAVGASAQQLANADERGGSPEVVETTERLRHDPALARLCRHVALAADQAVRQYLALLDRYRPGPGTPSAVMTGAASKNKGAQAEARAAQILSALADQLNNAEAGDGKYRVVTSLRVPAAISGNHGRAKTEWDVVLLWHPQPAGMKRAWEVRLLVEVKASIDAAATDLPRLLRGLHLLRQAESDKDYHFETNEGRITLRGASLAALPLAESKLPETVLYCCDAANGSSPRWLSAASRMQLLSAPASLDYAVSCQTDGQANPAGLERVWLDLLSARQYAELLNQYCTLRQARALVVDPQDLMDTIKEIGAQGG